jgi:mono/diheme cytochrome c family protein
MGYDIPGHPTQNLEVPNDISSPLGEFTAGTDYYNTGKMGDRWGTGLPPQLPIAMDLLKRGQKEFQVNCAVCHGATGQGNGITSKYGLLSIANYHQDKYRQMADGQIFNTISNVYNTMMAYGDTVTVKDLWGIIAYISEVSTRKSGMSRMINAKLWIPRNEPLARSCSRTFSVQESESAPIGFVRSGSSFFGDRVDHRTVGAGW